MTSLQTLNSTYNLNLKTYKHCKMPTFAPCKLHLQNQPRKTILLHLGLHNHVFFQTPTEFTPITSLMHMTCCFYHFCSCRHAVVSNHHTTHLIINYKEIPPIKNSQPSLDTYRLKIMRFLTISLPTCIILKSRDNSTFATYTSYCF